MSFLPVSGIMYSGENFDATMTGDDAIAPDESDTLSAAVSEITADEAALVQGNDQIDSAAVAADGLETIAEHVAEANEGDGIDESTAEIVEAAVESILRLGKIGVSAKRIGLPSTESFRSRSNRHRLGEATVESLKETAKNIWKSIIEAIRKSIDWVKGFFNKIFGAAERLARRAKALVEKSKELDDKKEDAEDIESDSLYNGILIDTRLVDTAELKVIYKFTSKLYSEHSNLVENLSSDGEKKADEYGDLISNFCKSIGMTTASAAIKKRVDNRADCVVMVSPTLPGNTTVYVTGADSFNSNDDSVDSAERTASYFKAGSVKTSEGKAKEDTTLKILDKGKISEFAQEIEMFANEIVKYKKELPKTERTKDKVIKKLESTVREESTRDPSGAGLSGGKHGPDGGGRLRDKKGSDVRKIVRIQATIFRKLMDEPTTTFAAKSITGMSKALEYAERSANQYNVRD